MATIKKGGAKLKAGGAKLKVYPAVPADKKFWRFAAKKSKRA